MALRAAMAILREATGLSGKISEQRPWKAQRFFIVSLITGKDTEGYILRAGSLKVEDRSHMVDPLTYAGYGSDETIRQCNSFPEIRREVDQFLQRFCDSTPKRLMANKAKIDVAILVYEEEKKAV